MVRQRASQARDAFGRVGKAQVEDLHASDQADSTVSASGNAGESVIMTDVISAVPSAGDSASPAAAGSATRPAGRKTGKKAGKRRRRVGRPRGPERVPLTVRILTATDERLTEAVEDTGKSPQYIVDEALSEYLARLGF
jgi:hypothetical protein